MAEDIPLVKTLEQYLANPELLTDKNIEKFSRSIKDKGRAMKLHREHRSARARLLHELGLKDLVCSAIKKGTAKLTLADVVQLACAIGCSVDISVSPQECAEESIDVVVTPAKGLGEVFDGHRDLWEMIRRRGDLVASQEWDSGGPGAGAGELQVYEYEGAYYVFHDAGVSEYDTLYEALEENGFKTKGMKKPKTRPEKKSSSPPMPSASVFEGSDDDGSWDRADSYMDEHDVWGWP